MAKKDAENEPRRTKRRPRPVVCWETGEVFPNTKAAAASIGVELASRISTAIMRRSAVGGYHWYYEDEPKPEASELSIPNCKEPRAVVCYETGEVYPNTVVAAEAVGLKDRFSIVKAIKNRSTAGGYHWYAQGESKPTKSELKKGRGRPGRTIVCWETGEVFEIAARAAEAVGLKRATSILAAAKNHGSAGGYHWYYEDEPKPDAAELSFFETKLNRAVICVETEEVFPSITVASKAVGLKNPSSLVTALKTKRTAGGYHWRYADETEPDTERRVPGRKQPVVCWETGEVFESLSAAGKSVGLDANYIAAAISTNTSSGGYHWYRYGDPKPDASQLKGSRTKTAHRVICWETGEVFESAAAAAAAVGHKNGTPIQAAIRKGTMSGGYHWYREGTKKPDASQLKNPQRLQARPVVCQETGEVFPSATAAAEAMGFKSASCIYMAIRQGTPSGIYHWHWG